MINAKTIFNGVLTTTSQHLVYESPSDKITTIKSARIVNNSGGSITVNLYKKTVATISYVFTPNLPLDNKETVELDDILQLEPGEQLLADCSSGTGVSMLVDGFESEPA